MQAYYTEKHNRDVEMTDLLFKLKSKYSHVFTPSENKQITNLIQQPPRRTAG
ncbi:hypothetical protein PR08_gp55 [Idiomarinaceae phage Phi1M2-2]|uniref:hypothetical protein n=1 Tax=Idiomarinaceae phage Phi1M2-2 TaxID=1527515 RepID=UPI0004F6C05F|nr:hypothetical protein PR08_gp55 [Idiomarinaceae phage Phi1M2-2]AIM40812.1 hypothetical protein M22_055 [Idiomarinaceae phage Phi1M2-2]